MSVCISMLRCHLFFAILCCFTCWCVLEHGSWGHALLHRARRAQTLRCLPAHCPAAPGPADRGEVSGLGRRGAGHAACQGCPRSRCWSRCCAALGSLPAQRSARPWPPVPAELAAARRGCSCQRSSGSAGVIFLTFPVKAAFCLEIL